MSKMKIIFSRTYINSGMFARILAVFVLCLLNPYSFAAGIKEIPIDNPKAVIANFYGSMSFEAGSRPNYQSIRPLFSDDAVILLRSSSGNVELAGAGEFIERLKHKVDEVGFEEFGLSFTPKKIDCKITATTAVCVTLLEVKYPGLDTQTINSTDVSTLELSNNGWLTTSSGLFVEVPNVTPPSIISFPVKQKATTRTRVVGKKWDRPLPFFAQNVIDRGFELPKPFGISIMPVVMRQDMILTDLDLSINGGPVTDIDFIDFSTPTAESNTLQIKLDAWLFPFMNIFGSVGLVKTDAIIPIVIPGASLSELLGIDCNGGPLQPDLCVRTLAGEATPTLQGTTFTVGSVLATGWEKMFFAVPFSFTWTELEGKDDTYTAMNISPRIGVTGDVRNWGAISTYIGVTYLDSTNTVNDTFYFDIGEGNTLALDYKIDQTNKDKWNYLIGFNWNLSDRWGAQAEAGFGGSRSNLISSLTYRY